MSFGTGHHPTTLFCLKQIDEHAPENESRSFLDAGSGSGILAISAAKLGYSPIEAWDFDPQAVHVATENAEQNNLAKELMFHVRDLTQMSLGGRQFDIICANLIYDLLIAECEKLKSWTAPGGRLILAGILMASTNLLFTLLAWSDKSEILFAVAVIFDDMAAAFATVAFVAFISMLVDRTYTATQYALLASIGTAGRTTLAASSGAMVDWLNGDWGIFFVITAVMVIPSLIFLYIIKKDIKLSEK